MEFVDLSGFSAMYVQDPRINTLYSMELLAHVLGTSAQQVNIFMTDTNVLAAERSLLNLVEGTGFQIEYIHATLLKGLTREHAESWLQIDSEDYVSGFHDRFKERGVTADKLITVTTVRHSPVSQPDPLLSNLGNFGVIALDKISRQLYGLSIEEIKKHREDRSERFMSEFNHRLPVLLSANGYSVLRRLYHPINDTHSIPEIPGEIVVETSEDRGLAQITVLYPAEK